MRNQDKSGIGLIRVALFTVHWAKLSFDAASIPGKSGSVAVQTLKKAKPTAAKGTYIKKITLSSTMGPRTLVRSRAGWLVKDIVMNFGLSR